MLMQWRVMKQKCNHFLHFCVFWLKDIAKYINMWQIIKSKPSVHFIPWCYYMTRTNMTSFCGITITNVKTKWTASSEFGTYSLCEQRRFRRACASAQSRQNLRCSLVQAVSQEEPSDRKPDPWSLWMAGHAQLKFVMTECSKTQIRLTGPKCLF